MSWPQWRFSIHLLVKPSKQVASVLMLMLQPQPAPSVTLPGLAGACSSLGCVRAQQCYGQAANERAAGRTPVATKECRRCKACKSAEEFYASKMTADGLQSYCKACYALAAQQRRARITAEGGAPERAEHEHAGVERHMHEQARPCALHPALWRPVLWSARCCARLAAKIGAKERAEPDHARLSATYRVGAPSEGLGWPRSAAKPAEARWHGCQH